MAEILGFRGEHFFLSNFYEHPCGYEKNGVILYGKTAEHVFQMMKSNYLRPGFPEYTRDFWRQRALTAPTPAKAKYHGRSMPIDRARWEANSFDVMLQVIRWKFQDEHLGNLLMATGDATLIEENDWGDTTWGTVNRKGKNQLGVILMQVRNELSQKWPSGKVHV